jgi:serine/threonine protein kinase
MRTPDAERPLIRGPRAATMRGIEGMSAPMSSDALANLLKRPPAKRFLGPYQLTEPLGKGGFAPVWLGREMFGDSELRTVAVKLFSIQGRGSKLQRKGGGKGGKPRSTAPQRARIIEEARALCRVEHPNVVRFYSIVTDDAETLLGLVMEHVRGRSLDERLASRARLPVLAVLEVGVAIASALAAVHRVGLIHRDVKPHNVIEAGGVYKLIDFGIAAAGPGARVERRAKLEPVVAPRRVVIDDLPLEVVGEKLTALTHQQLTRLRTEAADGLPVGTVGYIDPASIGAPATPRSDLYSLAAMLYECLSGAVPAHAAARVAGKAGLLGEVLDGRAPPPPVEALAADVPAPLSALLAELLDPDPDKRPPSAEAVLHELERIRRAERGQSRPLPPEEQGPFRGLGRFEPGDRDVFFGRSVEVATAVEILRSSSLLALIGPSGSGKSSLARAGVMPAIVDGALGAWPREWQPIICTPGHRPAAAVAAGLRDLCGDAARRPPHLVAAALRERARSSGRGVLLFIDQLEELVTLSEPSSRDWLVQLLATLSASLTPGLRCVVAARRDLLDPLLALGELGSLLTKSTMLVSPVSRATWSEVLRQALGAYGYRLEDERMGDELLDELGDAVSAMPLTQFALTELWNRRDAERKLLTRAALAEIGGVAGALDMHAERVRARLLSSGVSAAALQAVVMELTTPQGTRTTVTPAALMALDRAEECEAVLQAFERERLFVREGEGVTLAHEALLGQWERLRRWLAAAREDRLLAAEIERDAAAWIKDESPERVWRKRRLYAAEDLARRGRVRLSLSAQRFIGAGKRIEQNRRLIIGAVAAVLAGAGLIGALEYVQQIRAAEQRALDESALAERERLAAEAARDLAERSARETAEAHRLAERAKLNEERAKEEFRERLLELEARVEQAKTVAEWLELQDEVSREKKDHPPSPSPPPAPWSPNHW